MKRPLRTFLSIALVAVVALVAAGCEEGTAWIARVDKKPIDAPNFWSGVPLYTSLATQQQEMMPTTSDDDTFPMADAAGYARFLIEKHAIEALNDQNGTPMTPVAFSQAKDELVAGPAGAVYGDLPEWFVDQIAEYVAGSQILVAHHGADADIDDLVAETYEANKVQFAELCMDIIPGESESELAEARTRIEEGASFADVAKAVAAAQETGEEGQAIGAQGENADGDVGCLEAGTVSGWFADPGEVERLTEVEDDSLVGPVPVAGGIFMVLRIRSVEIPTLDEVRPQIEQQLGTPGAREAGEALNTYLMEQDIELNPRLGDWVQGVGYREPQGAEHPEGELELTPEMLGALG